jgi:UDP-N-acetylglucosamine acyltransferase
MLLGFHDHIDPKSSHPDVQIHPTAMVAKGAELGKGVVIGPGALIGPNVKLGDGVMVNGYAAVDGHTEIGAESVISSFATIGTPPQDLKYKGEETRLVIGARNQLKEYTNISRGTATGRGITTIGSDNLIMAYTHIAHDCNIGNYCVFANGVQLAGHVEVGDRVVFGGMSGGHQFCRFGNYAMIGAGSIVVQDVPPFCMVQGDRAEICGLNVVGLRRAGLKEQEFSNIKRMFRIVFKENLTLEDALRTIVETLPASSHKDLFVQFLKNSRRGICR